jgi:hypothetical protein
MVVAPELRDNALANRVFPTRAVGYLAAYHGVTQFLDIGTGIPTRPSVYETADAGSPWQDAVKVAYVDNDPVVAAHATAMLAVEDMAGTVLADLRALELVIRWGQGIPRLHRAGGAAPVRRPAFRPGGQPGVSERPGLSGPRAAGPRAATRTGGVSGSAYWQVSGKTYLRWTCGGPRRESSPPPGRQADALYTRSYWTLSRLRSVATRSRWSLCAARTSSLCARDAPT